MINTSFKTLLTPSLKIFLWFAILSSYIGLVIDMLGAIEVKNTFITYANGLTLFFITISLFLFSRNKDIRLPSGIFIISLVSCIVASNLYLLIRNDPIWQYYFLRDTCIFVILLTFTAFLLPKAYVYLLGISYCITVIIMWYFSKDSFVGVNVIFLIFMISSYGIGIELFSKKLRRTFKENEELNVLLALRDKEILEKENQRIAEQVILLRETIEIKNRELVSRAMFLAEHMEKNTWFAKKLESLVNFIEPKKAWELNKIVQDLQNEDKSHWEEFQIRFNDVHQDFYSNIKKDFSDLTTGELKLAAFLKLKLSSKEIAILTNTTKAGVDVSRSRLRKKLQMDKKDNIVDFLDKY